MDNTTPNTNTNNDRDRSRENKDFVQLYRQYIAQLAELGMEDAQALRVFLFLVRHMDAYNALAVPMSLMAEMLQLSRQTVSAKVHYLEDHGWIAIYKLGRQSVYIINPDVVWTSYADQKAYCKFPIIGMLSRDDNWDLAKTSRPTVRHLDTTIRQQLQELAMKEFPEPNPAGGASDA